MSVQKNWTKVTQRDDGVRRVFLFVPMAADGRMIGHIIKELPNIRNCAARKRRDGTPTATPFIRWFADPADLPEFMAHQHYLVHPPQPYTSLGWYIWAFDSSVAEAAASLLRREAEQWHRRRDEYRQTQRQAIPDTNRFASLDEGATVTTTYSIGGGSKPPAFLRNGDAVTTTYLP